MNTGNVTLDPLARAASVPDPAIEEVIDKRTGEIIDVASFIGSHRYDEMIVKRQQVRESLDANPHFICALCHQPVYVVGNQLKRFFFRHVSDADCAVTRGTLSQDEIRARKYHGLRESDAHRRIKALLSRSLSADPAYSDIAEEKTWSSASTSRYRRPDVQCRLGEHRLAFEIQLSTTFLDVVLARRNFYRDESGLLIWVMGSFDPEYRRMTTDDMLFSNNANLLVIDDETTERSERSGKLHVRCCYRTAFRNGSELAGDWAEAIVAFERLTLDTEGQRAFLYDHDGARQAVRDELDHDVAVRAEKLRDTFVERWLELGHLYAERYEHDAAWSDLRQALAAEGIDVSPDRDRKVTSLLNAILSVREGRPVGWDFAKLIQVAHHIAERNADLLAAFGAAVKIYGRDALLEAEDAKGTWARRRRAIRERMAAGAAEVSPNTDVLPLLHFLFPEVANSVQAYLARHPKESGDPHGTGTASAASMQTSR